MRLNPALARPSAAISATITVLLDLVVHLEVKFSASDVADVGAQAAHPDLCSSVAMVLDGRVVACDAGGVEREIGLAGSRSSAHDRSEADG
jgi:hypothetical protein